MVEVLLDSTFLLPTLGVEVKDIRTEDLEALKTLSKKVRFYCSYVSFVEILGKLARRFGVADLEIIRLGIRSLLESGCYTWVNPSHRALEAAFEIRVRGHRDNIDNILYSIALDSSMLFLSLDEDFKTFLQKNGYDAALMVGLKELQAASKR